MPKGKKADNEEELEEELTPEEQAELEQKNNEIAEEKIRKAEEKRKAAEAAAAESSERRYTKEDVSKIVAAEVAKQLELRERGIIEDDDIDPFAQKTIRIPRFLNKFIIGFKNTNSDEYNPDNVIQAFDVWNSQKGQNEAYVTVIFDELEENPDKPGEMRNKEMNLPLYTVINKSVKVVMDLMEVVEEDASYSTGKTEIAVVQPGQYNAGKTGNFVKMRVNMAKYTYKVKFPDGKIRTVGGEVVNW